MTESDKHFKYKFWFVVGLSAFGGIFNVFLIVYIKDATASGRISESSLLFWLSTCVAGAVGYMLGSSANQSKPTADTPPGTTTADISATVTTAAPVAEKNTTAT